MFINNLVETHCHILPGIDDGAKDVETSIKMVQKLQMQGAEKIIATPHYYSDSISLNDFISRRNAAAKKLQSSLPSESPQIIPAAEVYISKYLFNNDDISELCIGSSRYILIEHPFSCSFSYEIYDRLMNLICDYNVKPILAHIERYEALMDSMSVLDEFINMGCLTQVNISSFTNAHRSVRKKLFKYLEAGKIHLIGSDCHNLTSRPPQYNEGAEAIIEKCGSTALNTLIKNANSITQ